jgi:phenylalanyl-tRNA synthetase alpha chain
MTQQILDPRAYRRSLAVRDLTDAALGGHAMQLVVQRCLQALQAAWQCPLLVYRAPPIVSVSENYDELRYPSDGPSRDARYTRYVSQRTLLRTQTSAMIPPALRAIRAGAYEDILIACPGLTYRRDAIDRQHVGEPHQLDLWRVAQLRLTPSDLRAMIERVARALLPDAPLNLRATVHPYTIEGLEVHAQVGGIWYEVLECGLAHPEILQNAGLSPDRYSGLAMGVGLDRMLMLSKGIDDIRLLRAADPRIARQMLDLEPYQPVSVQPAIQRDLSIAVEATSSTEELGDRVRATLGDRVRNIEEIIILSECPYADLSETARGRLGLSPLQKNVLLRIVIRDLERTLTSNEANELRDEIYAALHQGGVKSWAARGG